MALASRSAVLDHFISVYHPPAQFENFHVGTTTWPNSDYFFCLSKMYELFNIICMYGHLFY